MWRQQSRRSKDLGAGLYFGSARFFLTTFRRTMSNVPSVPSLFVIFGSRECEVFEGELGSGLALAHLKSSQFLLPSKMYDCQT